MKKIKDIEVLLEGKNDRFELIKPMFFLHIGTLLTVKIIRIMGGWVEWFYESHGDDSAPINRSLMHIEINQESGRTMRYFKDETKDRSRIYYLHEFTLIQ